MNFARRKSELVADHLRTAIREGAFTDSLPSVRKWSASLGVSPGTLQAALMILKQEGLITSEAKKGFFLTRSSPRVRPHSPLVRWLWHDPRNRLLAIPPDILMAFSQALAAYDINFQVERCDEKRIRAIHADGSHRDEMLLFSNFGASFQRLFQKHRNVLNIGEPTQGIALPYVDCDVFSVFRHAAYRLLRQGCERIELLNIIGRRHPDSFKLLEDEFRKIREEAPRPFSGGLTLLPTPYDAQCRAVQQLANRFSGKQGLIVNAPLQPGLVAMILMDRGLRISKEVELLSVNCTPSQLAVYPPMAHYPYPVEEMAKVVCRVADLYFKTGARINLQKTIALSLQLP